MLSLQNQIKNIKQILNNKNENVKFDKDKDKEQLNNYLMDQMFKDDEDDEPITLQKALDFEIQYINTKNNKNSSIRKSKSKKKSSTEL